MANQTKKQLNSCRQTWSYLLQVNHHLYLFHVCFRPCVSFDFFDESPRRDPLNLKCIYTQCIHSVSLLQKLFTVYNLLLLWFNSFGHFLHCIYFCVLLKINMFSHVTKKMFSLILYILIQNSLCWNRWVARCWCETLKMLMISKHQHQIINLSFKWKNNE